MNHKNKTINFIEEAKKVHGDKYDYSKVEYINNSTKVCIICPTHGEFWQIPYDHIKGCECLKCGIENARKKRAKTTEHFITEARLIHGDKYDYSRVKYINNSTKVCIICPVHGEFWQTPQTHLKNRGCPICSSMPKSLIYGVGVRDVPHIKKDSNVYRIYQIWVKILQRCYSETSFEKRPTYIGCSVCEEWLLFSNFLDWYLKHYVKGWQIDKDILVRGNKVYSPETCCFVPHEVNSNLAPNKYKMTKHLGLEEGSGKWFARVGTTKGNLYSKAQTTYEEAFEEYKKMKKQVLVDIANKYKEQLPHEVYNAICNWDFTKDTIIEI